MAILQGRIGAFRYARADGFPPSCARCVTYGLTGILKMQAMDAVDSRPLTITLRQGEQRAIQNRRRLLESAHKGQHSPEYGMGETVAADLPIRSRKATGPTLRQGQRSLHLR